ncbi:C6 finger domain-containing protein [Colletotrichum karsti]|uniref:C6 finger domain-containing protein n=1 Tax=Colletotrichum karsti TaxID=1095194 RepID=A0A9P6I3N4_9PEZI|nr:C6 finger domain-containing protein [Colletotrichum karsti]KAF9871345.1 C6 finger domain-containing protein [Colletotrichum karsti]
MAFLHHAESHMSEFMNLRGNVGLIIDIAVEHALTAPHLLDQLLALSALHLSTQDTALASSFNRQATELQTRALGCFADAKEHISDTTYMPTFVFATLLGIHVLYETLQRDYGSLAGFVDGFVGYSRLHRGVRAVTETYWPKILQSNLKPLLYIPVLAQQVDSQPPGSETEQFKEFLAASPAVSASNNGCLPALSGIQWVLDIARQEPSRFDVGVNAVMAWPLCISEEYIEALRQHQPEALVVLAFYAATLHRYRQFWAFGTSGSSIVHMVANSIGSFWQDALSWPLQVLIES